MPLGRAVCVFSVNNSGRFKELRSKLTRLLGTTTSYASHCNGGQMDLYWLGALSSSHMRNS